MESRRTKIAADEIARLHAHVTPVNVEWFDVFHRFQFLLARVTRTQALRGRENLCAGRNAADTCVICRWAFDALDECTALVFFTIKAAMTCVLWTEDLFLAAEAVRLWPLSETALMEGETTLLIGTLEEIRLFTAAGGRSVDDDLRRADNAVLVVVDAVLADESRLDVHLNDAVVVIAVAGHVSNFLALLIE